MSPPHSATRTTLGPLLALLALCGPLSAQWDEDFEEDAPPAFWEGRLSLRALAREGRGVQQDRDLYGRLRLRGGRASRDAWTFGLAARGAWDADGATPGGDAFGSLQDGRGGRFDPRLDEAWAAYHELPAEASLRLGRQTRRDTPVMLHFDGGQLELPFAVGDAASRNTAGRDRAAATARWAWSAPSAPGTAARCASTRSTCRTSGSSAGAATPSSACAPPTPAATVASAAQPPSAPSTARPTRPRSTLGGAAPTATCGSR
jgi:hypothetical protein